MGSRGCGSQAGRVERPVAEGDGVKQVAEGWEAEGDQPEAKGQAAEGGGWYVHASPKEGSGRRGGGWYVHASSLLYGRKNS